MLKALHSHIFAGKLREVFAASPLVLLYQTVGSLDAAAASAQLQAALDKQLPAAGLRVRMCRVRNTVAASAGSGELGQLCAASNLLVGFGPATSSSSSSASGSDAAAAPPQQQEERRSARRDSLQDLLAGLFPQSSKDSASSSSGGSGSGSSAAQVAVAAARLSHKELAKAFQVGSSLPEKQPVVLLAAFYGRERVRLADLKKWVALDEGATWAELLAALEAPAAGLLALERPAEALAAALEAAAADEVVGLLEMRGAGAGAAAEAAAEAEGGAGAAAAAAAAGG